VARDLLGPALVDRVAAREPVDQLDVFVGELESAVVERRFPAVEGRGGRGGDSPLWVV